MILLLFSYFLWAQEPAPCNCDTNQTLSAEQLKTIQSLAKPIVLNAAPDCQTQECQIIRWGRELFDKYPHCKKFFIDEKGMKGELTNLIFNEIAEDVSQNLGNSVFLKSYPDVEQICPGFKTMNSTSRVVFYAYTFEVLAYFETTCNPDKNNNRAEVPNGPAVGLYQMELSPELRSWRGPNCKVSRSVIKTAAGNTGCALEIFKSQLKKNGQLFGRRKPNNKLDVVSYWHAFNEPKIRYRTRTITKNGKKIQETYALPADSESVHERYKRYLARFPLCQKIESKN